MKLNIYTSQNQCAHNVRIRKWLVQKLYLFLISSQLMFFLSWEYLKSRFIMIQREWCTLTKESIRKVNQENSKQLSICFQVCVNADGRLRCSLVVSTQSIVSLKTRLQIVFVSQWGDQLAALPSLELKGFQNEFSMPSLEKLWENQNDW